MKSSRRELLPHHSCAFWFNSISFLSFVFVFVFPPAPLWRDWTIPHLTCRTRSFYVSCCARCTCVDPAPRRICAIVSKCARWSIVNPFIPIGYELCEAAHSFGMVGVLVAFGDRHGLRPLKASGFSPLRGERLGVGCAAARSRTCRCATRRILGRLRRRVRHSPDILTCRLRRPAELAVPGNRLRRFPVTSLCRCATHWCSLRN